jgi:hypothetical protein
LKEIVLSEAEPSDQLTPSKEVLYESAALQESVVNDLSLIAWEDHGFPHRVTTDFASKFEEMKITCWPYGVAETTAVKLDPMRKTFAPNRKADHRVH